MTPDEEERLAEATRSSLAKAGLSGETLKLALSGMAKARSTREAREAAFHQRYQPWTECPAGDDVALMVRGDDEADRAFYPFAWPREGSRL